MTGTSVESLREDPLPPSAQSIVAATAFPNVASWGEGVCCLARRVQFLA